MMGENNPAREARKRILRKMILPDMSREDVEDLDAAIVRRNRRRILRVAAVIAIALLVFSLYKTVSGHRRYQEAQMVWENTEVGGAAVDYEVFGSRVLKVTTDGITCFSTSGDVVWSQGYTMKNPSLCLNGDYGAVADLQSDSAMIFDQEGIRGNVSTIYSILNLTISSHGVLALELDDANVNYVNFYDNTGRELDIRIKTMLSGDGYPMDLSLSPKGTGLMSSVVYLDQGTMQNQIVFYNFDVGQSESNRMVGYFTFDDTMFPYVQYLTDTVACAFGDNQICLFSLRNESRPEQIESIPMETEIRSVFASEDRVGVICGGTDGGKVLNVYNTSGRRVFTREIDFDYTQAEFCQGNVLIYNNQECLILTDSGTLKFEGSMGTSIQKMIYNGGNSCLVFGDSSLKMMRLK